MYHLTWYTTHDKYDALSWVSSKRCIQYARFSQDLRDEAWLRTLLWRSVEKSEAKAAPRACAANDDPWRAAITPLFKGKLHKKWGTRAGSAVSGVQSWRLYPASHLAVRGVAVVATTSLQSPSHTTLNYVVTNNRQQQSLETGAS